MSSWLEASIALSVPVAVAYERATRFEELPDFVPRLQAVERLGGDRLLLVAQLSGERHECQAQVTAHRGHRRLRIDVDDRVRAWATVRFRATRAGATELRAEVECELDPLRARLLDMLADPQRQLDAGLQRFKEAVEAGHRNGRVPARARRAAGA